MKKQILAIAMLGVAATMLSACGGVKTADKEDFCERTVGKKSGRKCDCAMKAVNKNYGGKASDFVRSTLGDLGRDERKRIEKSLEDVKISAVKGFQEDISDCVSGDAD